LQRFQSTRTIKTTAKPTGMSKNTAGSMACITVIPIPASQLARRATVGTPEAERVHSSRNLCFRLSGSNHFHEHFPCLVRVLDFV
jgi:hypothetical protein